MLVSSGGGVVPAPEPDGGSGLGPRARRRRSRGGGRRRGRGIQHLGRDDPVLHVVAQLQQELASGVLLGQHVAALVVIEAEQHRALGTAAADLEQLVRLVVHVVMGRLLPDPALQPIPDRVVPVASPRGRLGVARLEQPVQ